MDRCRSPHLANGGAGYVEGVKRLGIPGLVISDAAYGVRDSGANGRYSTALPSSLGAASSWDADSACAYGTVIGSELRAQGYNMTLGGGVDLAREPRDGRTFEYAGEDPLLAGTIVGNLMKCEQAQHVVGDIKHYAMNDQETGRNFVNAVISKRGMQESDLLAFHIAISIANPGAVMCSYNRVNGDYACENSYLLRDVLKKRLGLQRLCRVGLGRNPLHGKSFSRRARSGAAHGQLLRRQVAGCRRCRARAAL